MNVSVAFLFEFRNHCIPSPFHFSLGFSKLNVVALCFYVVKRILIFSTYI